MLLAKEPATTHARNHLPRCEVLRIKFKRQIQKQNVYTTCTSHCQTMVRIHLREREIDMGSYLPPSLPPRGRISPLPLPCGVFAITVTNKHIDIRHKHIDLRHQYIDPHPQTPPSPPWGESPRVPSPHHAARSPLPLLTNLPERAHPKKR